MGNMKMKFIFFAICLTFKMNAAISISSIQKTDSRCLNNGSIKVIASSNMQIIYSLDSGPATVAPQVSNTFNGLAAGRYKVLVQNLANERDSIYVIINSDYIIPDFNQLITIPSCSNKPNGKIIGNPTSGTGVPPFTWRLRNVKTNQIRIKNTDIFDSIPAGDYVLTLTDSCQNTTVHNFEVKTTAKTFNHFESHIEKTSCQDIFAIVSFDYLPEFFPVTIKYKYQNQTESQVVHSAPSSGRIEKKLNYDPMDTLLYITAISNCGDSVLKTIFRNRYYSSSGCYKYLTCNSVMFDHGTINFPTKIITNSKNGTFVNEYSPNQGRGITINNVRFGDTIRKTIIICKDTFYRTIILQKDINTTISEHSYFDGCKGAFKYNIHPSYCINYPSLKYILIDKSTGQIVDSNSISLNTELKNFPGNKTYRLILRNNCNDTVFEQDILWKDTATNSAMDRLNYRIEKIYNNVCLDSTVSVKVKVVSGNKGGHIHIKSIKGSGIRSNSKTDYSYTLDSNINWETIEDNNTLMIYNLTVGRYYITFGNDECQSATTFFDVYPIDIANNYYSFKVIKACGDNNKLVINLSSKHYQTSICKKKTVQGWYSVYNTSTGLYVNNFGQKNFSYNYDDGFQFLDTVNYLKQGTYRINIVYEGGSSNLPLLCSYVNKNIEVPPYTRPQIKVVVKVRCNENTYVAFFPDSAHGVFPYKYEINQGPTTYPVQYLNYFTVNQLGNFQAKIWDTCGNANTMNFSVDTLKFDPIYESDKSCESRNLKIKYQSSPFFSYKWIRPNGNIHNGDSLLIDSVHLHDIGLYKVTRYVNFFGCRDSFQNTYLVNKHKFYHRYDTIYKGDSVHFAGQYRRTSAVFADTIYINPCDSFSLLNLVVIDTTIIDSTNLIIQKCIGDTLFYLDTFFTKTSKYTFRLRTKWGKKTVIDLNMEFDYHIWSRARKEICQGESYRGYSKTGIYRDTLPSSQKCDSIAELDLIVHPIYRNILDTTVCTQQHVIFCGESYDKTGEYTKRYQTLHGCDSLEILKLRVLDKPYQRYDTFNACKRFDYKRKPYFNNINLLDTLFNFLGCDSVYLFIHLNIGSTPLQFFDSINFCDTIRVAGILYYNNFYYKDTLRYSTGLKCDSMYRLFKYNHRKSSQLKLTIYPNTTTLYKGEKVKLSLTPANHYRWSNGDTIQQLEFNAQKDTSFSVVAWNTPLCKDTISLNLTVLEPGILDIPNAFAPDGMMENRIFKPNFKGMVEITRFEVYNRWGEKIYSTNTKENIGWNGSYKGEPVPSGVFTYLLEYKVNRSIFFKSGEVLLVR